MIGRQAVAVASATDVSNSARPSALENFVIRSWARAYLYGNGELSLHEAVDVLQQQAESSGLVKHLGQDVVQALMAVEFADC
jgi:hypothetical protein